MIITVYTQKFVQKQFVHSNSKGKYIFFVAG